MKKYISVLLLTITLFVLFGCSSIRTSSIEAMGEVTTKEYTNLNSNEIDVEDIYIKHEGTEKRVTFYTHSGTEKKIVITATQKVIDDISVKEHKGEIIIQGSKHKFYDTESIKIEAYGYKFDSIELENAEGEITGETVAKEFDLSISGNSNIKLSEMNGEELEANLSGSSLLTLSNVTCNVDIDASGDSEVNSINLEASNLDVSFSGMSKGTLYVNGADTEISLSGASSLTLIGNTSKLEVEGSGSSSLEATEYNVQDCEIELSGGSVVKANVSLSIIYKLSGDSYLLYKGSPTVKGNSTSGDSKVVNEADK